MAAHTLMLYCIVRGIKPYSILEIGVRGGVSTLAICKALEDGDIHSAYHCCDINPSAQKLQSSTKIHLVFEIMTSDELALIWRRSLNLLFIDGSHEYQQVKKDYTNFGRFVTKNGFIIFHDTYPPSEKYKSPSYCGDAYKILDDLKKDESVEFVTFPYSFGLTVCRKLFHPKL